MKSVADTLVLLPVRALRRLLWAPGDLGGAEAGFRSGCLDVRQLLLARGETAR